MLGIVSVARYCVFLVLLLAASWTVASGLNDCISEIEGLSGPELADHLESCRQTYAEPDTEPASNADDEGDDVGEDASEELSLPTIGDAGAQ